MTEPLVLDLKTMLPTIRMEFDKKELQMFRRDEANISCTYSGPCAIGCTLNADQLSYIIDNYLDHWSVGRLTQGGHLFCPSDQVNDLCDLQEAHDRVVRLKKYIATSEEREELIAGSTASFEAKLKELEEKYL